MAIPLAPIAGLALRYGTVALAAYALTRAAAPGRHDQRAEDVMDDLPEGLAIRRERDRVHAAGRSRRVFRLGPQGPGLEVDVRGFGRVRWRRV